MEHPLNKFAEISLTELDRRHVYCYRHRGNPFVLPFPDLSTGSPEHPFADGYDQAAAFRNRYELIRGHEAQSRVLPADEIPTP